MHHSRRKSGHGVSNTSTTDVRRAVTATDPSRFKRPTTLSRRTTPNSSAQKLGRSPREREREWQESYDERESFPQFCMACEKQFLPHDDKFLYCSEACRLYDQDAYAQDDAYKRGMSTERHHSSCISIPPQLDQLFSANIAWDDEQPLPAAPFVRDFCATVTQRPSAEPTVT
ncbi:hypothetical protein HYQ45_009822 [Verticillium longisporum]|uniref:Uncharacterized protein n=1 Tax=Verticillium longisporum TaxID=100787 RepID=A0A8I3APZ2_VERLO|nr:hypothetical protein HYQ45_009822 [Verticillium longisporum]